MKKGKKFTVSNVDNRDFSFDGIEFDVDQSKESNPFPGLNIPPVNYTDNQEHDAADELRYVHDVLMWVDKHPPQTGDILDSPVFFTVVFESRSQKDSFLESLGLFKYGNKYFDFKVWCEAFGIDVESGKSVHISHHGKEEGDTMSFNLDLDLDFSGFGEKKPKKEEIGETLKNIKADEKRTADYLAWAVDPSFWFCICFDTEDQKANFQKSLGISTESYAGFDLIWCHDFARPFHTDLEPCDFKPRVWSGKEDRRLVELIWNGEKE